MSYLCMLLVRYVAGVEFANPWQTAARCAAELRREISAPIDRACKDAPFGSLVGSSLSNPRIRNTVGPNVSLRETSLALSYKLSTQMVAEGRRTAACEVGARRALAPAVIGRAFR